MSRLRELYGLRDDASIARELNRPLASVRKMADRIFSGEPRRGPWTAAEIEELKRYFGLSEPEVIAKVLGRPLEEVQRQITNLGRVIHDAPWTRDEIAEFKRIYGTRTDDALARVFARPVEAIRGLAEEHALAKDKAFLRRLVGESATTMPRWTRAEIELLRQLYPDRPNLEIAHRLGRTVKGVVSKAHNLGLKKSTERLQRMGRENVSLRYQEDGAGREAVDGARSDGRGTRVDPGSTDGSPARPAAQRDEDLGDENLCEEELREAEIPRPDPADAPPAAPPRGRILPGPGSGS